MKINFFLLAISFICIVSLEATQSLGGMLIGDDDSFGISVTPSIGYLAGQAREIVYDTGEDSTEGMSSYNGYYLSELIWDLTKILYIGASSSANFGNRFYINAGIWTSMNDGTGYMNDYDWVYWNSFAGRPYNLHDRDGKKDLSHWSKSTVTIENSLLLDINVSYDLLPGNRWNLSALGGYRYIYWDWSDLVVDSMYDAVDDVLTVGINAIDYSLGLHIPYIGFGFGYHSSNGVFVISRISYSPFVVGQDHDHHILRTENGNIGGLHFYDEIYMGQFFSGSVGVGYEFSDFFSMKIQLAGDYLFETKGLTYIYGTPGGVETYSGTITGGAGIQYQALSFSANAVFSF